MLSQQEVSQLLREGYTMEDIHTAVSKVKQEDRLQKGYEQTQSQIDPRANASNSMFQVVTDQNMVKWQLELDNILERIDHILRGDKIKFEKGQMIWMPPTDKDKEGRLFNDYGIDKINEILSIYLNRNTILSNYEEKDINAIVYDFGCELSNLIYTKYEKFGLDTPDKRKEYPFVVQMLVNTVRNAYMRSLKGGERQSLREARQVTQSEALQPMGVNINVPQKERSILNPMRLMKGRYV